MKTKSFILLTFTCFFILTMPFYNFSMFVGNTSEKSFDEPPATGIGSGTLSETSATYETVEDLIIKAAIYFLKGKSSIYLLSSKLEAAEQEKVYYYDYQVTVNEALGYMRMAQYYYQALKNKAEVTPYNQEVITQLKTFDYNSFSRAYGLNRDIFNQVKSYLQNGDVRGVYARFLTYTENIISILETVQKDVYYWNFPKVETIWNLNQECAQMLLFGQYVTRVFYKISI